MIRRRSILLAAAAAAVGAPAFAQTAPPHTLAGTDTAGEPLRLDELARGRVALVSFFSAGCALCTHELRLMREFWGANRDKPFVLLGVNLDERASDVRDYASLLATTVPAVQRFPIVWRGAPGHRDSFGAIVRRPTHFVLDRQQRPVLRREGAFLPTDWDDLWLALQGTP